jgi:hypothetical protein
VQPDPAATPRTTPFDDGPGGMAIDANADGLLGTELFDLDQDGVVDTVAVDSNADAVVDTYTVDSDGDGFADATMFDLDQEGVVDQTVGLGYDAMSDPATDASYVDTTGGTAEEGGQSLTNVPDDLSAQDVNQAYEDNVSAQAVQTGMTQMYDAMHAQYGMDLS